MLSTTMLPKMNGTGTFTRNATMPANAVALHDELCKLDGPSAKDGRGHCPEMWMLKGESHMSEVFSLDTSDQTVARPVLEFVKKAK